MRKILGLLLLLASMQLAAQTYPITSINISLPANPDANTANWGSGTSLFTITANAKAVNGRVDGYVTESKILVTIKKGGAKVCGSFTANSAPVSNFNTLTKVWSGSNAVSLLGQGCVLPAGEYELTVQFFGAGAAGLAPLSEEKTKPFSIRAKEQLSYQPPQAISPANGMVLSEADTKKPITFRWTTVVPKPQEPVTYRLRIWQLMQGQTGTQAMRTNQPTITKDVDNMTQAIINNLIDGPCKLPYLCDFVWNVQALNREGKSIGGNSGMSGANEFSIMGNYGITIQNLVVECPKGTTYSFMVNVGNPNNQIAIFDKLEIVSVNGSLITPINIPITPLTISPNGNITVFGSFNYASMINIVAIKAYIKEQANPLLNAASSYTTDTLQSCDPCDLNKVEASNNSIAVLNATNGTIKIQNTVSATPNNITKIVADLVYVKFKVNNTSCNRCNKEKKQQNNFMAQNVIANGTQWKINGNGAISHNSTNGITRSLTFNSTSSNGVNITSGIQINHTIGLPPTSCCGDEVEVWIRYSVWDKDCHVCDKLVKATLIRPNVCPDGTHTDNDTSPNKK